MVNPPPSLRPDTLLYIYFIDGIVPADCTVDDDHYLGNWIEEKFSFLFFTRSANDKVHQVLDRYNNCTLLDEYTMSYLQWQGGEIEPVRIGRFLFNPAWIKASPGENDIAITLDSGVVFGNGAHPTTQACLEAMEIACAGKKVSRVLDLGCGTGILALAAGRLGCQQVVAVDYNFLASRTARHNVHLNGLDDRILVINGKAEEAVASPADLLIANIHYEVMEKLLRAPGFTNHKWFILSGLLRSEAQQIEHRLRELPVLVLKKWCRDGIWHTILGITETSI